jgi:hypothetical protein
LQLNQKLLQRELEELAAEGQQLHQKLREADLLVQEQDFNLKSLHAEKEGLTQ